MKTVTLKKAADIVRGLEAYISNEMKFKSFVRVSVYSNFTMKDSHEEANKSAWRTIESFSQLVHLQYKIRQLIAHNNALHGINALLNREAELNKIRAYLTNCVIQSENIGDEYENVEEAENALQNRRERILNNESGNDRYGQSVVSACVLMDDDVKKIKDMINKIKLDLQEIKDHVQKINFSTMVEIDDESAAILNEIGLMK